jgi:hypothetical protein
MGKHLVTSGSGHRVVQCRMYLIPDIALRVLDTMILLGARVDGGEAF